MKKFACEPGTTVYPCLVRNSSVSDRVVRIDLAPQRNQRPCPAAPPWLAAALVIETLARLGAQRRDRPELLEVVGPRKRKPSAQPSHAVDLRERPRHDDVLVRRHQVDARLVIRKIVIRLVDDHYRTRRLVLQQPHNVSLRSHRAGRVVRDSRCSTLPPWESPQPSPSHHARSSASTSPRTSGPHHVRNTWPLLVAGIARRPAACPARGSTSVLGSSVPPTPETNPHSPASIQRDPAQCSPSPG